MSRPNEREVLPREYELHAVDVGTHPATLESLSSLPTQDADRESTLRPSTQSVAKQSRGSSATHSHQASTQTIEQDHLTQFPQNLERSASTSDRRHGNISTPLLSRLQQSSTTWFLAVLTSSLLGLSTWFIYTEFINIKQAPKHLQISPGHVVNIVNVLSQLNVFLVWMLVDSTFELLRWAMSCRDQGVLTTTFIAMSRATGLLGVADLLRVSGWHRLWCMQRLLFKIACFFLGFLLLSNPDFKTIYSPQGDFVSNVIAGLAPLNGYSLVPPSVINIYFMTFTRAVLTDRTLVASVPPLSCSGSDCTSIILPGGLNLVRIPAYWTEEPEVVLIYDAPGYQLEFFPIPGGFVFNETSDCKLYTTSNEAIHICITTNGTKILAGWSICTSDLYYHNLCLNDTSWTDQPDESTTLVLHKRMTTTAYDRTNFSILSIVSMSDPEPPTPASIMEVVANYTHIFSLAFSSIPAVLNTSDPNFSTYAATYCNQWDIGFVLRLFQDDFRTYTLGPLNVLQGFLTVPMQFSTTAWQAASFDTLPSDLLTKASPASLTNRALGKLWVLIVFTGGVGSLIIWAVAVLFVVTVWGPNCPNSTRFPEIDIVARARLTNPTSPDSIGGVAAAPDLETLSRKNGMGNGTSRDFRARFKGTRLYVGDLDGSIGIATQSNKVTRLHQRGFYK